jgi:hypothetical protein
MTSRLIGVGRGEGRMRPVNVVDVQPALAREGWKIHAMLMLPGLTAQGGRGALGWPEVPWLALVRLC